LYDELKSNWTKKKKDKILIFSYTNKIILDIYNKFDIDIVRFDISEYAQNCGIKDKEFINSDSLMTHLKEINKNAAGDDFNKLIAVDLPLDCIYSGNGYSLDKVVKFYRETYTDILILDIDYNILELTDILSKMKIPVIIYSRNKILNADNKYLLEMHNKLIDIESMGALMLITENYPVSFIQNIKKTIQIPVLCNEKNNKTDGFYAKYSNVFGMFQNDFIKYLNLKDLISDSIQDCIADNR
jgi:ketopantoate hydroxymethyltransferase